MTKGTQALALLSISLAFVAACAVPEEPRRWPSPGMLPSPILRDPELKECWAHLRRPQDCISSLYESSRTGEVSLSKECCYAVMSLSNRCFQRIFKGVPFPRGFGRKIDAYCDSDHGESPAPAPAPAL